MPGSYDVNKLSLSFGIRQQFMPVCYTGMSLSYACLIDLALCLRFVFFILHCEDSEIVSAFNPMHTWLFCLGSAYPLGFLAYESQSSFTKEALS